jgi:hypothetical protein
MVLGKKKRFKSPFAVSIKSHTTICGIN